jgi:hypothetical protein
MCWFKSHFLAKTGQKSPQKSDYSIGTWNFPNKYFKNIFGG